MGRENESETLLHLEIRNRTLACRYYNHTNLSIITTAANPNQNHFKWKKIYLYVAQKIISLHGNEELKTNRWKSKS